MVNKGPLTESDKRLLPKTIVQHCYINRINRSARKQYCCRNDRKQISTPFISIVVLTKIFVSTLFNGVSHRIEMYSFILKRKKKRNRRDRSVRNGKITGEGYRFREGWIRYSIEEHWQAAFQQRAFTPLRVCIHAWTNNVVPVESWSPEHPYAVRGRRKQISRLDLFVYAGSRVRVQSRLRSPPPSSARLLIGHLRNPCPRPNSALFAQFTVKHWPQTILVGREDVVGGRGVSRTAIGSFPLFAPSRQIGRRGHPTRIYTARGGDDGRYAALLRTSGTAYSGKKKGDRE